MAPDYNFIDQISKILFTIYFAEMLEFCIYQPYDTYSEPTAPCIASWPAAMKLLTMIDKRVRVFQQPIPSQCWDNIYIYFYVA